MSGRVHVHVCSCIFDNEHFYRLCTHDNVHFYIATSHVITVIEYLLVLFSMFASRNILKNRSDSQIFLFYDLQSNAIQKRQVM